jgi:glucosylceramidase
LPSDKEVLIVSTSKNGLRFKQSTTNFGAERISIDEDLETNATNLFKVRNEIVIERSKRFQKIIGFGNAFTGAVLHNLQQVPDLKENIYKSYFSKEVGNAFNMMRIPIGGCDFDIEPWAYEFPDDFQLSNFTRLDERDLDRIKEIKVLQSISSNFDIKFLGAAWSSPRWMKTNNAWTGRAFLKDSCYQVWADYHVKYLELMKQNGINYWAISTGNEPLNGVHWHGYITFMSLGWTPEKQAKWVSENLGPALKNSTKVSHVKIFTGDDQRYIFPSWFDRMYSSYPKSKDFIDGHQVHWYFDKTTIANNLDVTFNKYPEKLLVASEACSGDRPWEHIPLLGDWQRAEDYVIDILEDLNHHISAWIDWNMILNEQGGPNYVKNFVDSPIIVNTTSKDEFYKQPIFYILGHFSRFLVPDSIRLGSSSGLASIVTAFLRPDGLTAVVIYNK